MDDPTVFMVAYLLNSAAWFIAGVGVGNLWRELRDDIHHH